MFKTPAKPQVRFYCVISMDADDVRRRLQEKLKLSANKLAERAFYALAVEQNIEIDRSQAAA
jgi:hypothetical protein